MTKDTNKMIACCRDIIQYGTFRNLEGVWVHYLFSMVILEALDDLNSKIDFIMKEI